MNIIREEKKIYKKIKYFENKLFHRESLYIQCMEQYLILKNFSECISSTTVEYYQRERERDDK